MPLPVSNLLFSASFEEGPQARTFIGVTTMALGGRFGVYHGRQPRDVFSSGRSGQGRALDMSPDQVRVHPGDDVKACFRLAGGICLREGALSAWFCATNQAPKIRIYRQTPDFAGFPPGLFEIVLPSPSETGRLSIASRDFSMTRHPFGRPGDFLDGSWHRLAFVWDEAEGVRLLVDGSELLSTWGAGAFDLGYASIGNLTLSAARFDDVLLFDRPPDAEAEEALHRGLPLPSESPARPRTGAQAWRRTSLGWSGGGAAIPARGQTRIRALTPDDARELRNWGWRSVDGCEDSGWPRWYKTYAFLGGGGLHLRWNAPETFHYVRVAGFLQDAWLAPGDAWERPADTEPLFRFAGASFVTTYPIPAPCALPAASVYLEHPASRYLLDHRTLQEIAFLQVDHAVAMRDSPLLEAPLRPEPSEGLGVLNAMRLVGWYRPDERQLIAARSEAEGISSTAPDAAVRSLQAFRAVHLLTPRGAADLPLGALRVRLQVQGWQAGDRVNLRLHDPNFAWRSLVDVDVELHQAENLDVCLEFAPTILPAGSEMMLTLVASRDGRLRCGTGGSTLSLYGPPLPQALESFRTAQLRLLNGFFQALSEPRPWGDPVGRDERLRIANPLYDALAGLRDALHQRFPEDRHARAVMLFTHGRDNAFFRSLPPPPLDADPATPRWAALLQAVLGQFIAFTDWWTDERLAPNGEFGSQYNDDTDLVQDWPSIALIHDPDHKYRRAVRRLADYCWTHHIRNGLNARMTDVLHCYEEGLNTQANAALMDYGNPVLMERLRATARRYDGFLMTPAVDGRRTFTGSFFNDRTVDASRQQNAQYAHMMLHPGLVLLWYNGSPELTRILAEFYEGNPDRYGTPGKGWPEDLPRALFLQTGDSRYLAGIDSTPANPWRLRMLNLRDCPPETLHSLTNDTAFEASAGTLELGDSRFFPRYAAWHYTQDKRHLLPALESLFKAAWSLQPVLTEAQQSADRVPIKKNLTDFLYLGGIPASRFHYAPFLAVSYEGFSPRFAAIVLEDTPQSLRWVGYSSESGTQAGALRVWNLVPGTYVVRQGPDHNGDDRIDGPAQEEILRLKRHETIPVSLPAGRCWIVEVSCQDRETPLHQRCDLAVSAEDALLEEDCLTVVAHNLGCHPTGPFRIELADDAGTLLARMEEAEGLAGFSLTEDSSKSCRIEGTFRTPLTVSLHGPREEITESNNRARIQAATGAATR